MSFSVDDVESGASLVERGICGMQRRVDFLKLWRELAAVTKMLDIEVTPVPKPVKGKGTRRRGYMQLSAGPATATEQSLKVMVGETDMPQALQAHAVRAAAEALDLHQGTDYKDVAFYIKSVTSLP